VCHNRFDAGYQIVAERRNFPRHGEYGPLFLGCYNVRNRKEFKSLAVYSRVAFAQIAANPAYVDESGNSLLHEPAFP